MLSLSSIAQPGDYKLFALKLFYARSLWAMRNAMSRMGVYDRQEYTSRIAVGDARKRYLQSLFAIYDVKEMARLDLAWWTFDAMVWTDRFLKSRRNPTVFEYGSGASTVWLARRAHSVTSVEDDEDFYADVDAIKPRNVNYIFAGADSTFNDRYESQRRDLRGRSYEGYVTALSLNEDKYDLIVIDGRARRECILLAPRFLKPGGAILVDNTDMRRYRDLRPLDAKKMVVTKGLTPCLPYPTETTIFVAT